MQIIESSTVIPNILDARFDAKLSEDLDGQTLEADELHHIEFGGLGLQDLQRCHSKAVLGAKESSIFQEVLQDGYAVVFLN